MYFTLFVLGALAYGFIRNRIELNQIAKDEDESNG
jgi:hypothetical protein